MPTPEAHKARKATRRARQWILVALLILVLSIWYTNVNQTLNLREGCGRSKVSYRVNAENWRTAQQARASAFKATHQAFDGKAAASYGQHAAILERLAETDCSKAYQMPFPLHLPF